MTPRDTPLEHALRDLIRILDSLGALHCLLGALALGAWGAPRTTQDVDVLLAVEPADRGRLLEALAAGGFDQDREWAEQNPMIRDVHLRLRCGPVAIDLMFPRDAHDHECLARRRREAIGNLSVWVISPEDLILHKLKAGRAQDFVDVLSVLHHQRSGLDQPYLSQWAARLGIQQELGYCLEQAARAREG